MSEPLDARGTNSGKITMREHSVRKNLMTPAEKEILRLRVENRALKLRVTRLQAAMRRAEKVLADGNTADVVGRIRASRE